MRYHTRGRPAWSDTTALVHFNAGHSIHSRNAPAKAMEQHRYVNLCFGFMHMYLCPRTALFCEESVKLACTSAKQERTSQLDERPRRSDHMS